jgi:nitroreductase
MELRDVLRSTPATREFLNEPVPDEVVYDLLEVARFAPNGGNRQAWRVVLVKDPEVRRRLRDEFVLGQREYVAHVRAGQVPFAPGPDGRWSGPGVDLAAAPQGAAAQDGFAERIDRAPVLLVVLADLTRLACVDNGLPRQSIAGGASMYPFCHNILLAARDAGLGGVMTTTLARREAAVRELLGLPEQFAVASLVVLGRPNKVVTKLRRTPVEDFATVDRFDGEPFGRPA